MCALLGYLFKFSLREREVPKSFRGNGANRALHIFPKALVIIARKIVRKNRNHFWHIASSCVKTKNTPKNRVFFLDNTGFFGPFEKKLRDEKKL